MTTPGAPPPEVHPRLAALLRIAGDLRGLPSDRFKARLKSELLRGAGPRYGAPLATHADIQARLAELAAAPDCVAYDVHAALRDLPELTMRFLAPLNRCTIGVSSFSTESHWERHPAGDELLYLLEGEVDITTLTEDGPVYANARAGSLFICPQGRWHRLSPRSPVSLLFATPGDGTEHSDAARPRQPRRSPGAPHRQEGSAPLQAHDLQAALRSVPALTITASTTAAEADAACRQVASLDGVSLGVMRFSGLTPWERHPDGDELLFALDGAVDVTVLTDDGPLQTTLRAGSVFVCPRGLWHRQLPRPSVAMLYGTPTKTTEVSFADDPRA